MYVHTVCCTVSAILSLLSHLVHVHYSLSSNHVCKTINICILVHMCNPFLLLSLCVQVCGMLISELKKLVGFPLLHLSSEMCTKWNDLEKAQTAVIRGAYFLLWRRGHNSAAERSKSLLKAVSERERVLQSLLDTVMDFRKSKRRFQVQREQGFGQVSMCAAGVACLLCQWSGALLKLLLHACILPMQLRTVLV